jgi:hypothetical protein
MSPTTVFLHPGPAAARKPTYAVVYDCILLLLIFREGGGVWEFDTGFN